MVYSWMGMNFSWRKRTIPEAGRESMATPHAKASTAPRSSEPGERNSNVTRWWSAGSGQASKAAQQCAVVSLAFAGLACAMPASRHGRHCQHAVLTCKIRTKVLVALPQSNMSSARSSSDRRAQWAAS
eukprot:6710445-Alexandrium_andersonii.AAC.1